MVRQLDRTFGRERYLLIGAYARDLHVHACAGWPLLRATADIDICIAVHDQDHLVIELERLESGGRLRTRRRMPISPTEDMPVDVLPFGAIAPGGMFADDGVEYDVHGLEDAYSSPEFFVLDDGLRVRTPSLEAMIGLKLIAWAIRGKGTDAKDLAALLDVSADEPYSEAIWEESDGSYEYELALEGPHLRGRYLAKTFRDDARHRVLDILDPRADQRARLAVSTPSRVPGGPTRDDQYEAFRAGLLREMSS